MLRVGDPGGSLRGGPLRVGELLLRVLRLLAFGRVAVQRVVQVRVRLVQILGLALRRLPSIGQGDFGAADRLVTRGRGEFRVLERDLVAGDRVATGVRGPVALKLPLCVAHGDLEERPVVLRLLQVPFGVADIERRALRCVLGGGERVLGVLGGLAVPADALQDGAKVLLGRGHGRRGGAGGLLGLRELLFGGRDPAGGVVDAPVRVTK